MDFEEQLKSCYDDAVRFARALSGSQQDGDDLLQEALVKAWQAYPRIKKPESFKPWLFRIISNANVSLKRLGWVKRMVGLDNVVEEPNPDELPFEEKDLVRTALKVVPHDQRVALILFEVLGMSVIEIAEYQKVSISAVKSRLTRGRERLRKRYEELSKMEVRDGTGIVQIG